MDAAIKELKKNVVIKAVKGLYRGQTRIDDDAGYRGEVKVCLERARLITQSYRETEGEPMVMRRAKALKKILEGMTIYIQDREPLVGNMAADAKAKPPQWGFSSSPLVAGGIVTVWAGGADGKSVIGL